MTLACKLCGRNFEEMKSKVHYRDVEVTYEALANVIHKDMPLCDACEGELPGSIYMDRVDE